VSAAPLAALALAWAWDHLWGEPPDRWHPVAWLGRLLGPVGERLCGLKPVAAFVGGLLAWCGIAIGLWLLGLGLTWALRPWPLWAQALALGVLLKPCLAWSMLRDEVRAVEQALQQGLPQGRARLSRLVSREVDRLGAEEVREAALSTLAENLNDSLVAPLFWFAVAGLPGALVYRFANTADAMWGYRGRWEWAGKWAACADDVLSWLPARLTALLLAPLELLRPRLWREAARTPSPNGGWPMGALALRLGVRLRKPGVYALNVAAPSPQAAQLARGLVVCGQAAALSWLGCALLIWGLPR